MFAASLQTRSDGAKKVPHKESPGVLMRPLKAGIHLGARTLDGGFIRGLEDLSLNGYFS